MPDKCVQSLTVPAFAPVLMCWPEVPFPHYSGTCGKREPQQSSNSRRAQLLLQL